MHRSGVVASAKKNAPLKLSGALHDCHCVKQAAMIPIGLTIHHT